MYRYRNLLLSMMTAGVLLSSAAAATTLPGVNELVTCTDEDTLSTQIGTTDCSHGGVASIVTDPFVMLQASAAAGVGTNGTEAFASLGFSFEIVGGTPSDQVPILITTNLATEVQGKNAHVDSRITVSPQPSIPGSAVQEFTCADIENAAVLCNGIPDTEFDGTLSVTAFADVLGSVQMVVSVGASDGSDAIGSADPMIEIDPTYLATHPGLTIALSDGVGNGLPPSSPTGVPEPSSLALLAVGLAALVGLRRHATAPGGAYSPG
jgi:PEP-CTERM motif